jgi:hypothetical protein
MSILYTGTSNGTQFQFSSSYSVLSTSQSGSLTYYKVNVTSLIDKLTVESGILFYDSSGTVDALQFMGQNMTGTQASELAISLMEPFVAELSFSAESSVYSQYVTQLNQTQITIGSTPVNVQNYKANNTPFQVSSCGVTGTVNSLLIQVGQVANSSYGNLITYMEFSGSNSVGGGNGVTSTFTMQITGLTVA